jgi:hypothetical protein
MDLENLNQAGRWVSREMLFFQKTEDCERADQAISSMMRASHIVPAILICSLVDKSLRYWE